MKAPENSGQSILLLISAARPRLLRFCLDHSTKTLHRKPLNQFILQWGIWFQNNWCSRKLLWSTINGKRQKGSLTQLRSSKNIYCNNFGFNFHPSCYIFIYTAKSWKLHTPSSGDHTGSPVLVTVTNKLPCNILTSSSTYCFLFYSYNLVRSIYFCHFCADLRELYVITCTFLLKWPSQHVIELITPTSTSLMDLHGDMVSDSSPPVCQEISWLGLVASKGLRGSDRPGWI